MGSHALEQLAGRCLFVGFDGPTLPKDLVDRLDAGLGGIVLFKRNVESPGQVAALVGEARAHAPRLVVAVDQEGGRVQRLKAPLTVLPPARRLGELDDVALTGSLGRLAGDELACLGIDLDFAPVLDVDTNPASPVIGDRSFGPDPGTVIRHGLAFARGLAAAGVTPVAKHFPGHGDAALDSHLALPTVAHARPRLEAIELAPFAAWVAARIGPVMIAHLLVPALDPHRVATVSPEIVDVGLRRRLGFAGVVFSDDLEMGALAALGGPPGVAVAAVRAGLTGLLVCRDAGAREATVAALVREAERDDAFRDRLAAAAELNATIAPLERPARRPDWLGSADHLRRQSALLAALAARP